MPWSQNHRRETDGAGWWQQEGRGFSICTCMPQPVRCLPEKVRVLGARKGWGSLYLGGNFRAGMEYPVLPSLTPCCTPGGAKKEGWLPSTVCCAHCVHSLQAALMWQVKMHQGPHTLYQGIKVMAETAAMALFLIRFMSALWAGVALDRIPQAEI